MCFIKVWDFPSENYDNNDELLEKILEEESDFDWFWSFLLSEEEKELTWKDSPLELLSTWKKWRKIPLIINDTKNNTKDKTHWILD